MYWFFYQKHIVISTLHMHNPTDSIYARTIGTIGNNMPWLEYQEIATDSEMHAIFMDTTSKNNM